MSGKIFIFFVALAVVSAIPLSEYQYDPEEVETTYEITPDEAYELHRIRRSPQDGGWSANPNIGRDENGNTIGNVEVKHKGRDHDFNAGWGKVISGPNRAKPTWHVGGTIRW